jgi:hypothetical protein
VANVIEAILGSYKLSDYLESIGVHAVSNSGGRIKYLCPIHNDTNPSFYVFTHKEYEYFHCFACGAHGDLINFVSLYEKINIGQSIYKLSKVLKLPHDLRGIDMAVKESERKILSSSGDESALQISILCRNYLKWVDYHPEEVEFIEEVYKKIDKLVAMADGDALKASHDFLVSYGIYKRSCEFAAKREKERSILVSM